MCEALNTLSKTNENEGRKNSFVTHLSAKQQIKISSLVGKKCEVSCRLGKTESIVLWDTGSQVSILSDKVLRENFQNLEPHELSEILDEDCDLKLMAANNTPVRYTGYVEIEFELLNENSVGPFLVSKAVITNPVIGYNVTKEVIQQMSKGNTTDVKSIMPNELMINSVKSSFQQISKQNAEALINLILDSSNDELACIKSPKASISIPPKTLKRLNRRGNAVINEHKTPVLFTPDEIRAWPPGLEINETLATIPKKSFRINIEIYNSTDHPILLNGRTVLSRVELLNSITPYEVQLQEGSRSHVKAKVKTDSASVSVDVKEGISDKIKEENNDFLSQFDLSSLNDDQKSRVSNMLIEESDSFSKGQDDIGCAKDFQLSINLSDQTPVQKTYNAIPKPLYPEVKHYIEDLLNKGFITKSRSNYSSPVVCVRKKDASLRLCVDYRQLNERPIPDRHPLPQIKDTFESLVGTVSLPCWIKEKPIIRGLCDTNINI